LCFFREKKDILLDLEPDKKCMAAEGAWCARRREVGGGGRKGRTGADEGDAQQARLYERWSWTVDFVPGLRDARLLATASR